MPFLVLREQQEGLRLYALADQAESHTLGRRPEMDLSMPWDSEVSGVHAELQCLGGEWAIVDDDLSRNGTYVNGERQDQGSRRGGDLCSHWRADSGAVVRMADRRGPAD